MTIEQYKSSSKLAIIAYATLFVSQIGLAAPQSQAPFLEKDQVLGQSPKASQGPFEMKPNEELQAKYIQEVADKTDKAIWDGQKPAEELAPRVVRFMSTSADESVVIINAGIKQGIVLGTVYDALRVARNHLDTDFTTNEYSWIKIGEVKITEPHEDFSLARVTRQSTELSKTFFTKFPNVMSGDKLVRQKITLVRNKLISPSKALAYHDLFVDPKANPRSFELTDEGRERLAEVSSYFAALRAPILMVESYTDDEGAAEANQIESYQRALTIRQYLVEELGFEPSRVVAIGFGEANLTDESRVAGFQERNRRIVFKVNGVARPM